MARIKTEPVPGAVALSVTNSKEGMGRITLAEALPIMRDTYSRLEAGDIPFGPVGASLYGTEIKISEPFKQRRTVSKVLDVFASGPAEQTRLIGKKQGWVPLETTDHFALTFRNPDGEVSTVPTASGQVLFRVSSKSLGLVLSTVHVPATFYQPRDGKVNSFTFNDIPTAGQTVAFKLIRGDKKDVEDLKDIGAVNSLPTLLGGNGVDAVEQRIAERAGNHAWLSGFRKRIDRIIGGVREHTHGNRKASSESIDALEAFRKSAE